jgi:hypothetical protein
MYVNPRVAGASEVDVEPCARVWAHAQAEQETATDEEWRRRDTEEAIDAQASGDAAFHNGAC